MYRGQAGLQGVYITPAHIPFARTQFHNPTYLQGRLKNAVYLNAQKEKEIGLVNNIALFQPHSTLENPH